MIGLLQRVDQARVEVGTRTIASISRGILVLIGIQQQDTEAKADRLLTRLLNYRVFPDREGKMNLSVLDIQGGVLLVPQFTLAADTRKGNRPSFSPAASPERGATLFDYLAREAGRVYAAAATGQFGADMQVTLTNDGPVTFWLQVE